MISGITFDPDKFGYYTVGDIKTYSKIESIELEHTLKKPSIWHFNDEIFSKIDWTIEPEQDLWSMYKARCRQIRDAYDYVVLIYSGGSDSHNILQSWIAADCKIDEIATCWNYDAHSERQSFQNAEINNVVLPDMEFLKKQGYDFKFRLIDISQLSLDVIDHYGMDFKYYTNRYPSPNNPAKALLREKIPEYQSMVSSGKKMCFVWGIEKPTLYHRNDTYFFNFTDQVDNCVSPYVQERYHQGWYDELFFWTPDYPLLPVKGCHVLMNFVKTCNDPKFYQNERTVYGYNKTLNMYLTVDSVKTLLYHKWSNDIFCNGKAPSFILSPRDAWIANSNLPQAANYMAIIKDLVTSTTKYGSWYTNGNIKVHATANYYLE